MTSNIDALKEVFVALGGDAADVANMTVNAEVIHAIALQIPTALASVLPEVSASNNGAVLKVADGKWGIGTDAT